MSAEESLERVRQYNRAEKERLVELRKKQPLGKSTLGLAEELELERINKPYADFVMNGEFHMRKLLDFTVFARQKVLRGDIEEGSKAEELLARLFEFFTNNPELLEEMEKQLEKEKKERPELFN